MKQIIGLLAIVTAIFIFWSYPVLYPLKLLVVFFHESSHALITVLTGGEVLELMLDAQQGGHVISVGGNRFLTLSSGYLGSLVWGIVIYLLAVRTRFDKPLMGALGASIIGMAFFFSSESFAMTFSIIVGVVMMASAYFVPMKINDMILRVIGLTSMLYAPLDIYSDTIQRSHLRSDAFMLAEEIGGSTMLWGGIWISISVVLLALTLYVSLKGEEPRESP